MVHCSKKLAGVPFVQHLEENRYLESRRTLLNQHSATVEIFHNNCDHNCGRSGHLKCGYILNFYLIITDLNLNTQMWLMATVLDGSSKYMVWF